MRIVVRPLNPTEEAIADRITGALHEFLAAAMKFDQDAFVADRLADEVTLEVVVVSLARQSIDADIAKMAAQTQIPPAQIIRGGYRPRWSDVVPPTPVPSPCPGCGRKRDIEGVLCSACQHHRAIQMIRHDGTIRFTANDS